MDLSKEETNEEEYSDIPIDISDIINICKEYNKLGGDIQNQIDYIDNMHYQPKIGYSASNPGGLKLTDSSQIFNKYINFSK